MKYFIILSIFFLGSIINAFAADDIVLDISVLQGVWITKSTVEMHIKTVGSFIEIELIDTGEDPSQVIIKNINWDGEYLSFVSICPDTNYKIQHKICIISQCLLKDNISGDANISNLEWRKRKCTCR